MTGLSGGVHYVRKAIGYANQTPMLWPVGCRPAKENKTKNPKSSSGEESLFTYFTVAFYEYTSQNVSILQLG